MKNKKRKSGEHQYLEFINSVNKKGYERMGLMTSWAWYDDPKRLAFMISRYKFVSKMFFDFKKVAEVGCGDGFGSRVVSSSVGHLDCYDFDIELLESVNLIHAIDYAKNIGSKVVGIVGRDGGYTYKNCNACVLIPNINTKSVTPHAEAFQAVVWHLIISHPDIKVNQTKW